MHINVTLISHWCESIVTKTNVICISRDALGRGENSLFVCAMSLLQLTKDEKYLR